MKKNYDCIDIMKFICSFLIVVLHTNPFPKYKSMIFPLTHCAVPFFFMASSFFVWKKIIKAKEETERDQIIKQYVTGIFKIYFFWLIATLPVTLHTKDYAKGGYLVAILKILRDFLFHSTWRSSWYLMASIIGMVVTYYVLYKRKCNEKVWLLACGITYTFCCLTSAYSMVLHNNAAIWKGFSLYRLIFTAPYTSYPVSFIWIFIGKKYAEGWESLDKYFTKMFKIRYCLFVCAVAALLLEANIVNKLNLTYLTEDCYFMLVPVCTLLFRICVESNRNIKYARIFRKVSTITYCVQGSVVELTGNGLGSMLIVLAVCWSVAAGWLLWKYLRRNALRR